MSCCLFIQGDPNQNPLFQMAASLKLCISDPMLVKPKCVWEAVDFLKNCKQTAENANKFSTINKTTAYQTHFGFANKWSEMHSFRGAAIWNNGFWFGSPCRKRTKDTITRIKTTGMNKFCKMSIFPTANVNFVKLLSMMHAKEILPREPQEEPLRLILFCLPFHP